MDKALLKTNLTAAIAALQAATVALDVEPATADQIAKAKQAGEILGLTGEKLNAFVKAQTSPTPVATPAPAAVAAPAVESLTKADVGVIVGEAIGEAFKAIFSRDAAPAAPAPKQTTIAVTKVNDGKQPEAAVTAAPEGVHNQAAAIELVKANKGQELSNDDLIRMGLMK